MTTPYYSDDWLTVYHGDTRAVMAEMEPESVNCVVTSPPYWGLRDYGTATWVGGDSAHDHSFQSDAGATSQRVGRSYQQGHPHRDCSCGAIREDGQLGLEPTPEAYVEAMVAVFREVRRVLRKDGTVWLNLGDSYAGSWGAQSRANGNDIGSTLEGGSMLSARQIAAHPKGTLTGSLKDTPGLKPKDRCMIPARVALALQADGWWLRDEIVWSKPNPMPSSVRDRTTPAHEMVYLLTKSARYAYDGDAIKEPMAQSSIQRINQPSFDSQTGGPKDYANGTNPNQSARKALENIAATHRRTPAGWNVNHDASDKLGRYDQRQNPTWAERKAAGAHAGGHGGGNIEGSGTQRSVHGNGLSHDLGRGEMRNKRSVWTVPSQAYPDAHFATFPEALIEPMILAGCPEGGTVLDPFAGSGTTGLVAQRLSRRAVLIDLSMDYLGQLMDRNRDIPLGLGA